MKNQLFGKAAALVMGSLMIVSGQTLAMESNKQEVTNAEALGEFEVLIAQNEATVPKEPQDIAVNAINLAETKIGDSLGEVDAKIKAESSKKISVDVLNLAKTLVGNAKAVTDVAILSKEGAEIALNALNQAESSLGDAEAQLTALIQVEGDDAKVAADLVNVAKTAVGDASAKTKVAVEQAN